MGAPNDQLSDENKDTDGSANDKLSDIDRDSNRRTE